MGLTGLAQITVELTSKCNRSCKWCGRAAIRDEMELGEMDFGLLEKIARQIPESVTVQFHKDGDPLMYSRLGDALDLFPNHITSIVTNGRRLLEFEDEIFRKYTSLCISIMEGDGDADEVLEDFHDFDYSYGFNRQRGHLVKLVGDVTYDEYWYYHLTGIHGVKFITRDLHKPEGSWDYHKKPPVIPESGICYDLLHKPSINWKGHFYICNRFSPHGEGMIGDLNHESLADIWNGVVRKMYVDSHKRGNRRLPLCENCEYYGIIAGGES